MFTQLEKVLLSQTKEMCTWVQHPNLFGQKCALIQSNVKKFANQPNVVDFPSLRAYLRKLLLCSKAFSDEG